MRSEQEHFEELNEAHANSFASVCNRACRDLPAGFEIIVRLERHCGTLTLVNPDGEETEFAEDGNLGPLVSSAIELAKAWCEAPQQSKCELCGKMFDGAGTICSRECVEAELKHSGIRHDDI